MATRTRTPKAEPEVEAVQPEYQLEPIDGELEMQLNVLGSSMKIFRTRTAENYPGWSHMMSDLFDVIKQAKEVMAQ